MRLGGRGGSEPALKSVGASTAREGHAAVVGSNPTNVYATYDPGQGIHNPPPESCTLHEVRHNHGEGRNVMKDMESTESAVGADHGLATPHPPCNQS